MRATCRDGLLDDTLPFWMAHAIDRESGDCLSSLDRDGAILRPDKSVWIQGRFAWLLATLHPTVEPREEWLDMKRSVWSPAFRRFLDADRPKPGLQTRQNENCCRRAATP